MEAGAFRGTVRLTQVSIHKAGRKLGNREPRQAANPFDPVGTALPTHSAAKTGVHRTCPDGEHGSLLT